MSSLVKKPVSAGQFNAELAESLLRPGPIEWAVHWQASVDSTQDLARRAAERGAVEGWTVVTEWQRRGRGRLGRRWETPPGRDLLFSVVLRPSPSLLSLLPLLAGVAIADGIERATGLSPDLKWPNDLIWAGSKLAGLLLESPAGGLAVLGVGVNVNSERESLPPGAVSVAAALGRPFAREPLLAQILGSLGDCLARSRAEGDSWVVPAWRARSSMLGKPVSFEQGGGSQSGLAEDVEADGALRVRLDDGRLTRVRAGEVHLLRR